MSVLCCHGTSGQEIHMRRVGGDQPPAGRKSPSSAPTGCSFAAVPAAARYFSRSLGRSTARRNARTETGVAGSVKNPKRWHHRKELDMAPRRRRGRRGNHEGSIVQRTDGRWQARVFVGIENGRRRMKYFMGRTREDVTDALNRALGKVAAGDAASVTTDDAVISGALAAGRRRGTRPAAYARRLSPDHRDAHFSPRRSRAVDPVDPAVPAGVVDGLEDTGRLDGTTTV